VDCSKFVDQIGRRITPHIKRELIVLLIAYYVAFMIAGDLAAYAIGLVTELEFGGHVSLIVFLALYFLFLWIAWILAVRLTKPKHAEAGSAPSS
jgi:membrane protein implicated in regulation of membrane protease activity